MKILLIGDHCSDQYAYCDISRLCPEAPVPVLKSDKQTDNPGMAGNVYVNVNKINKSFFKSKFDIELISNSNDIYKTRYVDEKSNQMLLRVDGHDYSDERFDPTMLNEDYDAIIVADYNKGFLTEEDLELISNIAPYTFIDTKKNFGDWILGYSFIKINEKEYLENGWKYKTENIVITKAEKGCCFMDNNYPIKKPSEVRDVSGAGDTFMAGLVTEYIKTKDIRIAIKFAQKCTTSVVQKPGVVTI